MFSISAITKIAVVNILMNVSNSIFPIIFKNAPLYREIKKYQKKPHKEDSNIHLEIAFINILMCFLCLSSCYCILI